MTNLADLQQWRDALFEARLSGIREVHDANGEVTVYKSDAEMATALAAVDRAIADYSYAQPVKTITFTTSKGL